MTLSSTNDLFFLVATIVIIWVAVFLCWALYELATLLRQGNKVVGETREKIARVENAAMAIRERLESTLSYFGTFAEIGKTAMSFFKAREEPKLEPKKRGKRLLDEDEE